MVKNWKPRWLEAYERHGTVVAACKVVRINRDTAYRHRREDPEFAAEWDRLENTVTEILEATLTRIALDDTRGHDQIRALEISLRARRPAKYREGLKVEHGGTVGVRPEVDEQVNATIDALLAETDRLTGRLADLAANGASAPAR